MGDYNSCPRCGRKAKDDFSSNWFPVHTCRDCGEKYCEECGKGSGKKCPECGSSNYSDYDKVHA